MLKTYFLENSKIVEGTNSENCISVYVNPDENEKKMLVDTYAIDEHTLNSALDPDELSRLEFEPNHVAIIFKRPQNYTGKESMLFRITSLGVFLFKNHLILVTSDETPLFEAKQFLKVSSLPELMLKLIYRSIFHFLEHLKVINMITDDLESKINTAMENRYLINLFSLEKSLVYYLNSISSNGVLIERLKINSQKLSFHSEEIEFIDDMLIENNQCYKQAEIYSNILASLMDARASIVGNNLNVLMKTLNIITIGIMVPTFIVSAFSMNVTIPLQKYQWAFWIIMGMAVFSVLALIYVWRHKKW